MLLHFAVGPKRRRAGALQRVDRNTQHPVLSTFSYEQLARTEIRRMADTLATLHMWAQVVGKIRLKQTSLVNHWWNVPLYVFRAWPHHHGHALCDRYFEIEFDSSSQTADRMHDGALKLLDLRPQSVADFYAEVMAALRELKSK